MKRGGDRAKDWRDNSYVDLHHGGRVERVLERHVQCRRCLSWQGGKRFRGQCTVHNKATALNARCPAFTCSSVMAITIVLETEVTKGTLYKVIDSGEAAYGLAEWKKTSG